MRSATALCATGKIESIVEYTSGDGKVAREKVARRRKAKRNQAQTQWRGKTVFGLCASNANEGYTATPCAARRTSFPALYANFTPRSLSLSLHPPPLFFSLGALARFSSPSAARNYALGLISRSRKRVAVLFVSPFGRRVSTQATRTHTRAAIQVGGKK